VKKFNLPDLDVGIQDYPDDLVELLSDPDASKEKKNESRQRAAQWAEDGFVLLWGQKRQQSSPSCSSCHPVCRVRRPRFGLRQLHATFVVDRRSLVESHENGGVVRGQASLGSTSSVKPANWPVWREAPKRKDVRPAPLVRPKRRGSATRRGLPFWQIIQYLTQNQCAFF
jgi:hypothetical protein